MLGSMVYMLLQSGGPADTEGVLDPGVLVPGVIIPG